MAIFLIGNTNQHQTPGLSLKELRPGESNPKTGQTGESCQSQIGSYEIARTGS